MKSIQKFINLPSLSLSKPDETQKRLPSIAENQGEDKPKLMDFDQKIKFLMQKLQIEYEFNNSVESISELSKI